MDAVRPIVAGSLRTLGAVFVFVSSLAAGVVLHLDAPATRHAVAAHVSAALANVFAGTIAIERIGHLSLAGVEDVRVSIDDPSGAHVIVADGISARIAPRTLVKSLFSSSGPLVVELSKVSVRDADVDIDDDPAGPLRLATVFERKSVAASTTASTPGRGVSFSIGSIAIAHARVHGQLVGVPPIDATIDSLAASLAVANGSIKLELGRADIATHGMPRGVDATGEAHATLTLPAPNGRGVSVDASWKGEVGAIAETATFAYDGARIDAVADVPIVTPSALRALWPESPIEAPASVHAEAHGVLSTIDVRAHVGAADGAVDLSGTVDVGDAKSAKIHIDARAIDLAALLDKAPASDFGLSADMTASLHPDGSFASDARVEIAKGTIAGAALPATTIRATVGHDDANGLHGDATVTPHEPGATATIDVHLRPKNGGALEASFDVTASAPQLGAIALVGSATRGRASVRAHGTFDLSTQRIDAKLEARVGGIAHGSVQLGSLSVTATASGPVAAPLVVAEAHADDLAVGTMKVQSIRATASGVPPNIRTTVAVRATSIPAVDAHADLDLRSVTTIRNIDAVLSRNEERAHATAGVVRIRGGGFDAEDALVEGVGAPARVTIRTSPHAITVRALSAGLDIGRLARLLGIHETIDGDTAAFDIDATLSDGGADGHIAASVSRCNIRGVGDVSANIEVALENRRAMGKAHVALGDIASVDASFKRLELGAGGSPIAAIRGAWGGVDFSGRADLAKLRALFPAATSSLGGLSGDVVLEGHLLRDSSTDDTPEVRLSGYTSHLAVTARPTGDAPPGWQLTGTDVGLSARIDGTSGAAELSLRAQDSKGVLASIDAKASEVPYTKLLAAPERAMTVLEAVPIVARIDVPRRSVADFPVDLPVGDARGDLTAVFVVGGTVGRPSLDGSISMDHARSKFAPLDIPLDLIAAVHYDAVHALVKVGADVRDRHVLDGEIDIDAAYSDLIDTERRDPMPWTATAKAHIERFPLKTIATLDDRDIRGEMTGDIEIDGIHEDGKAKASLAVGGLTIADVAYPKASLGVNIDSAGFAATVDLEQADGFAKVDLSAGTKWGRALVPRIDGSQAIKMSLQAKAFHASALLPFAAGVLTELDGRIDGKATASFDPVARKGTSTGLLTFSDGQLEVASFGGELRDVGATLAWSPDGLVQIPKLTAQMSSGEVDASGSFRLEGLSLANANFVVTVPKKKRVPLTLEGVQLATVDGRLVLDATSSGADRGIKATIDVPTLHADLPVTGSRSVQTLGTMSNVTVHVKGRDGKVIHVTSAAPTVAKAAPVATGAPPISVTIKLGKDVEIRRGTDLSVSLEGEPAVSITDATRMSGQIRIPRGSLDVDGKPFRIESGTVTFVGDDPTNPQIVLTASWPAPDGATTVYADFVGPLKTGKVTLRSDPPHTKDEILALILYGTTEGQSTTASDAPPGTTAAAGAAGGIATQPLNRVLDDFGLAGGISTKIDTSTATPRPEVEFQIARDISIQIAWVLGVTPGTNPDTTLVTFDWRFLQRWSLQTTVGDSGTSILDVVWKYHY